MGPHSQTAISTKTVKRLNEKKRSSSDDYRPRLNERGGIVRTEKNAASKRKTRSTERGDLTPYKGTAERPLPRKQRLTVERGLGSTRERRSKKPLTTEPRSVVRVTLCTNEKQPLADKATKKKTAEQHECSTPHTKTEGTQLTRRWTTSENGCDMGR